MKKIALSPNGLRAVAIYIAVAGVVLGPLALLQLQRLPDFIAALLVLLHAGNAVATGLMLVSLFEHADCAKEQKERIALPHAFVGTKAGELGVSLCDLCKYEERDPIHSLKFRGQNIKFGTT